MVDNGDGVKVETAIPMLPTDKLALDLFCDRLRKSNSVNIDRPVRLTEYVQPIRKIGGIYKHFKTGGQQCKHYYEGDEDMWIRAYREKIRLKKILHQKDIDEIHQ